MRQVRMFHAHRGSDVGMTDWLRRAYESTVKENEQLLEHLRERDRTIDALSEELRLRKEAASYLPHLDRPADSTADGRTEPGSP